MAAEVSSLFRTISGRDMNESGGGGKSTAPITRDLLGGCCSLDSKELDLDLQVPSGWEKRLDLKSGKVYLQRCNSTNSSGSTMENKQEVGKLQDLNFPPSSSKLQLKLFDETNLDLKLVASSPSSSSSVHSVCTLEKVKYALERAEKESSRKRSMSLSNSSSSPLSNSLSYEIDQENSCASFAAGCPSCLLYVLISKSSPRCPRCNTVVPSPTLEKKPRIDLNISI